MDTLTVLAYSMLTNAVPLLKKRGNRMPTKTAMKRSKSDRFVAALSMLKSTTGARHINLLILATEAAASSFAPKKASVALVITPLLLLLFITNYCVSKYYYI